MARVVAAHRGPLRLLEPVLGLLRSVRDRPEFRDRLVRQRDDLVLHCFVYAVLRSAGDDDPDYRDLIRRALDAGLLDQAERVPHQIMEERLALEWGGFSVPLPAWDDLLAASLMVRQPNPLYLAELPAYSLTHLLLFLFGFGTRLPVPALLARLPDPAPLLATLLVRFCLEGHWDLVGELLLCWDCLRLPRTTVYRRAWDALLALQAEDGSFPGPQQYQKEGGKGDLFGERYHTTLVMILACEVHAGEGSGPHVVDHIMPPVKTARPAAPVPPGVARSTAEWLASVLPERIGSAEDLTATCQVLVGTRSCVALDPNLIPLYVSVADRFVTAAREVRGWESVAPALSIVCHGLLAGDQCLPAGDRRLPALAAFVGAAARALEANAPIHPIEDLLLCEKRVLLNRLGMGPEAPGLDAGRVLAWTRFFPLDNIVEGIEGLLLRTGSLTGYGTRASVLAGEDREGLAELIWGLAQSCLRAYDLPTGCKLVRAAIHLDLGSSTASALGAAVEFLLLHRRPQGGFGFVAAEQEAISAHMVDTFAPERDLSLPISVHCVWALAEATTPWRLYTSIGSPYAGGG